MTEIQYDRHRTVVLQAITREIVRGEVVSQYTLIDEWLGSKICHYVFDSKRFGKLWKTKKFERFNYFALEKMSLMEKLAFVKDVYAVSKAIASDIEGINAIRNALAHAFFPENLRAYRTKRGSSLETLTRPRYKGIEFSRWMVSIDSQRFAPRGALLDHGHPAENGQEVIHITGSASSRLKMPVNVGGCSSWH